MGEVTATRHANRKIEDERKRKWADGHEQWKHSNDVMERFMGQRNTTGTTTLMSRAQIASARSALDEWHRSPKSKANRAHFAMLLSGASLPDELVDEIIEQES